METNQLLEDRKVDYGNFDELALISQELKSVFKKHSIKSPLPAYQEEALEMIMHKIARLLNGNKYKIDTWQDIAGYATLVELKLREGK